VFLLASFPGQPELVGTALERGQTISFLPCTYRGGGGRKECLLVGKKTHLDQGGGGRKLVDKGWGGKSCWTKEEGLGVVVVEAEEEGRKKDEGRGDKERVFSCMREGRGKYFKYIFPL